VMMDHHSQPPGIDSLGISGPIDAEMDDQNVMFLTGPGDPQGVFPLTVLERMTSWWLVSSLISCAIDSARPHVPATATRMLRFLEG
jgi:hypothetical protein